MVNFEWDQTWSVSVGLGQIDDREKIVCKCKIKNAA